MDDLKQITKTAVIAANATTEMLMPHWLKCRDHEKVIMNYERKEDMSPVTELDREVEARIRDIVSSRHPTHRFLGEEHGASGDARSPYLWVVDPIDGTKKFVRGLPGFAALIAAFCEEQVVVGVSHAPALNETIVASRNEGAFLNKSERLHVSSVGGIHETFLAHGGIRHFGKTGRVSSLICLCNDVWGTKGFADFQSYHLLASGRIDAVLEPATKIWDIAAVSLIVEEAGGKVTDIHGSPLSVNSTTIIATNGLIHDQIVDYFSDHSDEGS